jgi:hypothetical protein
MVLVWASFWRTTLLKYALWRATIVTQSGCSMSVKVKGAACESARGCEGATSVSEGATCVRHASYASHAYHTLMPLTPSISHPQFCCILETVAPTRLFLLHPYTSNFLTPLMQLTFSSHSQPHTPHGCCTPTEASFTFTPCTLMPRTHSRRPHPYAPHTLAPLWKTNSIHVLGRHYGAY